MTFMILGRILWPNMANKCRYPSIPLRLPLVHVFTVIVAISVLDLYIVL